MSSNTPADSQSRIPTFARDVKIAFLGLFLPAVMIWFGSPTLFASNFLPHWYCYLGNQRLLWTNVITDLVIGLSYVAISLALISLARRAGPALPYPGIFWAFGLFIVTCGATHFLEVVTIWRPLYWLSAAAKVVTAVASLGTAAVLLLTAADIADFIRTARAAATRAGNERFRSLVQAAPMAVVGFDAQARINVWNPTAERMLGRKPETAQSGMEGSVPPEALAEYQEMLRKSLAGEVTTGLEMLLLRADGVRFPVSISAAPVRNQAGQLAGVVAIAEDITERNRIDLELKEKTAVLTAVTQALNSFLDQGDWSAASRHLLQFALRQTQSGYGFLGVVLDGSVLRVLAHEGVVWDTEINRELYEEKIRQHVSEGYFEVAYIHNLLGEVITRGETLIANSPMTDPRSGGLPAGLPRLDSFLGVPIFKGKETVGLIGVANRPGGYTGQELRYLEAMSQATGVLYDSYRQSLKRSALEEEQKRLESQVRQAQKMEVLGRLAGGVAHDFNNMLMVLSGCSELLDGSLPKESSARIYLDQIQRTTEKAAAVTKQLLAFSRKQVLEFRPIDLHEALTESEFMLPRLLGSDIALTIHHDAPNSWILSDPAQIGQVVANLAINARDAMPEGGQLAISTRNADRLPEESGNSDSLGNKWVVLEVGDTGSGMGEKTRAQIFEPFFTTKPAGKGTGLGLSTVYGIVKQSKGHIRVNSGPGKGTRFDLYFPLADVETSGSSVPFPEEKTVDVDGSGTILLADDEPALRQALAEILRAAGYVVLEAQNATEALEMAQKHPGKLDILLTDIVMPGLRGPELARRVTETHPEIQVVYMSGYAEGFPEAQLPPNSIFLQKPFRFATLLEQLKLIRRRS